MLGFENHTPQPVLEKEAAGKGGHPERSTHLIQEDQPFTFVVSVNANLIE